MLLYRKAFMALHLPDLNVQQSLSGPETKSAASLPESVMFDRRLTLRAADVSGKGRSK